MATNHDSTTIRGISPQPEHIVYDLASGRYAMYLSDKPVGYARTPHQTKTTLTALAAESHIHPCASLLDKLDILDRMSGEAAMFRVARSHLLRGVEIAVVEDGAAYQIDGLRVQPDPRRIGWPWRCQCEEARCWHAALCEALVMVQSEADGVTVVAVVMREA